MRMIARDSRAAAGLPHPARAMNRSQAQWRIHRLRRACCSSGIVSGSIVPSTPELTRGLRFILVRTASVSFISLLDALARHGVHARPEQRNALGSIDAELPLR